MFGNSCFSTSLPVFRFASPVWFWGRGGHGKTCIFQQQKWSSSHCTLKGHVEGQASPQLAILSLSINRFVHFCWTEAAGLAALPVPAKSPPFASLSPGSAMHAVSWQRVQVSFVKTIVEVGKWEKIDRDRSLPLWIRLSSLLSTLSPVFPPNFWFCWSPGTLDLTLHTEAATFTDSPNEWISPEASHKRLKEVMLFLQCEDSNPSLQRTWKIKETQHH